MKKLSKNFLVFFLVFLIITALFSLYSSPAEDIETVNLQTVVQEIEAGEVTSIKINGDTITLELTEDRKQEASKEPGESLSQLLANYQVDSEKLRAIPVEVEKPGGFTFWALNLLPFLIPFLLIGAFIYFMMRQVQGANSRAMTFGQSKARENTAQTQQNRVTFKDVAGVKEAKDELVEVVEFLRTPKKFLSLGAKIPKGVLLMGPPGTGKTLLARAVAGEASVPFFSISGSEFVEMFVGVGASRVRDLFRKAKRNAPCIVFIDEMDAVGRQRGAGLGGSNDEREQTLNQILVEMDGFDDRTNVIVMAATNRPDVLDAALLRPGRFDRRVIIDPPDLEDRLAILKVHSGKKPFAEDVKLRTIAERTPGFTGADLANLLNEGALLAARRNKKKVEMADIVESIEKVMLGPARRSFLLSPEEKKVTAYHEAGHALVAKMLPDADDVHKVSIISRGRAAGYTLKLPNRDKHLQTLPEFEAELAVLLAGQVTEREIFKEITTGASNDLKQATKISRRLITDYGMSSLGSRTFGNREEMIFLGREITEQRDYSEKVAEGIDKEISRFITTAQKTAHDIITKHRDKLDTIANLLLEKESIEQDDFEALFTSTKSEKKSPKPSKKVAPSQVAPSDEKA
ncbi:cell division protein FtsH [bacterium]|nr:cell division protein FtsH [bacterium]